MARIYKVVALVAALTLVPAASALAAKITGGTAQVTVSATAAQLLSSNGISATALAPATQSGMTFTFPIARGHFNLTTKHGRVVTKGGFELSKGINTLRARHLTIISNANGVSVWGLVVDHRHACRVVGHKHPHLVCHSVLRAGFARIATVANVQITGTTATGTLDLTAAAANALNRLAGQTIAHKGDVLGTATISPTFG
jgi:hypothetical protein